MADVVLRERDGTTATVAVYADYPANEVALGVAGGRAVYTRTGTDSGSGNALFDWSRFERDLPGVTAALAQGSATGLRYERHIGDAVVSGFGTKQTDPTTSTVMADTGALESGMYEVLVTAGASATAIFQIQHRDAANSSTTSTHILYAAAGQTAEYRWTYDIGAGERVRVMMNATLTGTAAANIQAREVFRSDRRTT